ncbi:hypothetical protein MTsPCn9_32490 [Croceitalea sp. MTPC9]|uniref:TlpA disulfide reductase family protein n=1 Tax=unclassified Croceitalea TaxID=2632280 RepID=UPI002B3C0AF3|nr:hypothetical protein MTsPCn6_32790 [Croceitalea sp. MTPC6]GMN18309.1 hypothetical protein MTsPCn9_32490 [Croceitalea sp. MTPC9]
MKQLTLLFVVFVFLMQSCKFEEKKTVAQEESIQTKKSSIDFPIYDFDGLEPLLNKEDDKTYIVNFWATWCKPCIEELPDFEQTYAEQKDNNVKMLLVSLDMPSMWEKRLVPFVKEKELKGEVVILDDPKMNEWIPKIDANWEGGIPATLIYNRDKRTFYPHGFTYEELNTELDKFLNE